MCNRYAFIADLAMLELTRALGVSIGFELESRYNIAPTNMVPVIQAVSGGLQMDLKRWGLVAPWERHAPKPHKSFDARAETVAEKKSFRSAFKSRRCLIPVSGFYEWTTEGKIKYPHYIYRSDEKPILFAGIYEPWAPPDAEPTDTVALLTTEPNALIATIHTRMPVILPWDIAPQWVDSAEQDQGRLLALLQQFPADQMAMHPVTREVNRSRDNTGGPRFISQIEASPN